MTTATQATAKTPQNTQFSATQAIPTTVYAQADKLFVHAGGEFRVIAAVGSYGKVALASTYPQGGFGVKTDTGWMRDGAAIAAHAAQAINAYPVLVRRVGVLEGRQADLLAKLKVAQVALQRRDTLSQGYVDALVAELGRSIARAS